MTTANWIQLFGTILALAVTWGGIQARLKSVEKQTDGHDKSRAAQGGRIGQLEERLARLEGSLDVAPPTEAAKRQRSRTRPIPVPEAIE